MASNYKKSTTIRDDQLTSLNNDIGASCKIEIYAGTQPANVGTAITSQTLLATLIGNATAFGTVSGGVLTASAITGSDAVATATASFFRIFKSDGTTACIDGTVDVSANSPDMVIQNTSIASGQAISITSLTITESGA